MRKRDSQHQSKLRFATRLCICATLLGITGIAYAQPKPTVLFVGVFQGGTADARAEAEVQQRLGDIGYTVRRPPAGSPKCAGAECLGEYPTRRFEEFALTGSIARTEGACRGELFLSFATDHAPLSRTVECHPDWSEPELYARLAETAGALADEGPRTLNEVRTAEDAKRKAKFWPWTWKRRLVVGVIGIALAGTAAGLGAAAGMHNRLSCLGYPACEPTFEDTSQGYEQQGNALTSQAFDSRIPLGVLSAAIAVEAAGLVVSLALP